MRGEEARKGIKDVQTEMRRRGITYTVMFKLCSYSLTLVMAEFSFLVNNVTEAQVIKRKLKLRTKILGSLK